MAKSSPWKPPFCDLVAKMLCITCQRPSGWAFVMTSMCSLTFAISSAAGASGAVSTAEQAEQAEHGGEGAWQAALVMV